MEIHFGVIDVIRIPISYSWRQPILSFLPSGNTISTGFQATVNMQSTMAISIDIPQRL